ncbi:uncharacterized protein EDB91DRAFT_796292 [Suillus paluster]|uniref:uncharacterized protein n=1 Tax=Suillus paluster TaxID=48578 RepID=UPI001B862988|nr:uncharacterized protein EDB91DRAFT_796292 [Suillus paluster]KAG1730150.1 hypothetical protein EDB91DRAFT_796292 [Suillus paluster]
MSSTDSDSFVDIPPSLLDQASNISKDLTTTGDVPPHGESEKKLPDMPDDWKRPSGPRARCFTTLAWFILGQPVNLEEVWQEVRKENGWKTYNDRLRHTMVGITVGQGLVTVADVACLLTPPIHNFDTIRSGIYPLLLMASVIYSIVGLCCQSLFTISTVFVEVIELFKEERGSNLRGRDVIIHVCLFRMTSPLLAWSLALLTGGLSIIVLCMNSFTALAVVVTVGILLDATFTRDKPRIRLSCSIFGVMWLAIILLYLVQTRNTPSVI